MRNWVAGVGVAMAAAMLGGCATSNPVRVTRFHLDQPIPPGAVAVLPAPGSTTGTLEFQLYARSVSGALAAQGFSPAGAGQYEAFLNIAREVRPIGVAQKPVTIGIGGGSFGGGIGGGGSIGFGVGRARQREVYVTQLSVQLRRLPQRDIVWEGRAITEADTRAQAAQPQATADKLAQALFAGFPGQSGRTITVP